MKEQILAVQRMQDFIGENLSQEIRLSDLAQSSLFSPWTLTDCFGSSWALRRRNTSANCGSPGQRRHCGIKRQK